MEGSGSDIFTYLFIWLVGLEIVHYHCGHLLAHIIRSEL
jgi:hypothetical protein